MFPGCPFFGGREVVPSLEVEMYGYYIGRG